MGSYRDKIEEEEQEQKVLRRKLMVNMHIGELEKMNVESYEYDHFVWLVKNKDKILRNKKLIDLIG